jgi:hypothetical protein
MPGTYNMSEVLNSLPRQNPKRVICDADFYHTDLPSGRAQTYIENCAGVVEVIVTATKKLGATQLFPNAKVTVVDPAIL